MDFLYTVKSKKIILDSLCTSAPTKIWFFGDVHRDTPSCDEERWKWFLTKSKKDTNAYYFGLGDYHDFASAKEKSKLLSADLHETTLNKFDMIVEADNRKFAEESAQMNGKCLGLIGGNHGWKFASGKLADEDLAERLKTDYLGWLCHYTLTFAENDDMTGRMKNVHIVACHGRAGGKTAGITITQVDDLRRIFPVADIYCVSEDTEILTIDGWKGVHEISISDYIYCYDNETDSIKISDLKEYVSYEYNGEMVSIKNTNTDQLLIPEHRVYYKYGYSDDKYLINTADHLSNIHSQIQLPLSSIIDETYSNMVGFTDDEISLAGWIVAEGHFKGEKGDHGSGILIYQKHIMKVNQIHDLLKRLDYKYSVRVRDDGMAVFYIKKESSDKIKTYVKSKTKLPLWLYYCNEEQFKLFFNSFVLGDGNWLSKTAGTIYSVSKELMDNFQSVLVLHGYRSHLKFKKGGFKNGGYVINFCKKRNTELNTKQKISKVDYNGFVWCVKTRYDTFIARRNGKVFITGNCMGHDHQRGAIPMSVLVPMLGNDGIWRLKQKRQFLCRAGSFKKAYTDGSAGYEVGRLLKPSDLGALKLSIGFHRDLRDGKDVTITDITAEV